MRLVLDTNIVVSGLLWRQAPAHLIDAALQGRIELFTSEALLLELSDVLPRAKLARRVAASRLTIPQLIARFAVLAQSVVPASIARVARDPDGDHVIACALAASADLVVSGDSDLSTSRPIKAFLSSAQPKHSRASSSSAPTPILKRTPAVSIQGRCVRHRRSGSHRLDLDQFLERAEKSQPFLLSERPYRLDRLVESAWREYCKRCTKGDREMLSWSSDNSHAGSPTIMVSGGLTPYIPMRIRAQGKGS